MPIDTLLNQLRNIVETMRRSGRKPLRIYLTYNQMQALRVELEIMHYHIDPANPHIFDIPLVLQPSGKSMWVSCIADNIDEVAK